MNSAIVRTSRKAAFCSRKDCRMPCSLGAIVAAASRVKLTKAKRPVPSRHAAASYSRQKRKVLARFGIDNKHRSNLNTIDVLRRTKGVKPMR